MNDTQTNRPSQINMLGGASISPTINSSWCRTRVSKDLKSKTWPLKPKDWMVWIWKVILDDRVAIGSTPCLRERPRPLERIQPYTNPPIAGQVVVVIQFQYALFVPGLPTLPIQSQQPRARTPPNLSYFFVVRAPPTLTHTKPAVPRPTPRNINKGIRKQRIGISFDSLR